MKLVAVTLLPPKLEQWFSPEAGHSRGLRNEGQGGAVSTGPGLVGRAVAAVI